MEIVETSEPVVKRRRTQELDKALVQTYVLDVNMNFFLGVRIYSDGSMESKIFEKTKLMNPEWKQFS